MRLFAQLAASYRCHCVVLCSETVLSQAITRFVQTMLVHASENRCWSAGGANKTVATLQTLAQAHNVDPDIYRLDPVAGYGHLDDMFGKAAEKDVFPSFSRFFE